MKGLKSSLFLGMLLVFVGCDNDDDMVMEQEFSNADVVALQSVTNDGTWQITEFIEDDENITSFFSGYSLTFNEDGSLVLQNADLSINGTWRIEYDDDDDDVEFEINVPTSLNESNEELDELSEDWYVVTYSNTRIQLAEDDSEDVLVLERI